MSELSFEQMLEDSVKTIRNGEKRTLSRAEEIRNSCQSKENRT